MRSTKSAGRYAKALLELAVEQACLETVELDMNAIVATAEGAPDFQVFLNSPVIKADKKNDVMSKLFPKMQPLTIAFIALITKNGRASVIPAIAKGFQELLENHRGIVSGTLTSASALSKESRDKIIDNLSKSITGKLQLTEMVDANLIGGFVVRIGDNQIDASVATQLRKLKQELTQ
jgi:F-type H+-transporting ATPase subunit delta